MPTSRNAKRETCVMVILLTVFFAVIANLQTWAQENTQTVQKELPALKTDQPPTI